MAEPVLIVKSRLATLGPGPGERGGSLFFVFSADSCNVLASALFL